MNNNVYGKFKNYSKNTLKNMNKDELIELLEIADHNYKVLQETFENQCKNFMNYVKNTSTFDLKK